MKELALEIVSNIVTKPEDVEINETADNGQKVLHIKVNPEDMSRVIGKEGRIIRSIRNILRIASLKRNEQILIHLEDDQHNLPHDD